MRYSVGEHWCAVIFALAFGALPFVGAAGVSPIVKNGGFDSMSGWPFAKPTFARWGHCGINGSCGVCYYDAAPREQRRFFQDVTLEPGRRYVCSMWTKTLFRPHVEGEGLHLQLEWLDADGRLLGTMQSEDLKGTNDTARTLSFETGWMPKEAKRFRIGAVFGLAAAGRAYLDEIAIEPIPLHGTVKGFYNSAYRGIVADGEVTFIADIHVEKDQPPISCKVHYVRSDGSKRMVALDGDFSCRLPVADFKMGEQDVAVVVTDEAGNERGRMADSFTRVAKLPERHVYFDEQGRTIVNGKRFFPFGLYLLGVKTNDIDMVANSPFNCVMPYCPPATTEIMDYCHQKRIMWIDAIKNIYAGSQWAPKCIKNHADEVAFLEKRVALLKDHPALLAWYVNDELERSYLPRLIERRSLMERLDPGHPCWSVMYQIRDMRAYLPSFDVIGLDCYPVPEKPASRMLEASRLVRTETLGMRPAWHVPQIFDWAVYPTHISKERLAKSRPPTYAEMRSMCWDAIACGANGLVFYSYFDLKKEPHGVKFSDSWAKCRRFGDEVKRYFPLLLADELRGENRLVTGVTCKQPEGSAAEPCGVRPVETRAWHHEGKDWVLVVNASASPVETVVRLVRGYRSLVADLGPAAMLAPDGKSFALQLPPLELAIISLN